MEAGRIDADQFQRARPFCVMTDAVDQVGDRVADDPGILGNLVFESVIPRNVRLSEAPSHGMPALVYDHNCPGSRAYIGLARELIGRLPENRKAA